MELLSFFDLEDDLTSFFAEDAIILPDWLNNVEKRLFVEKTISLLKKFSKFEDPIVNSCNYQKKRLQQMQTPLYLIFCCETSKTFLEF